MVGIKKRGRLEIVHDVLALILWESRRSSAGKIPTSKNAMAFKLGRRHQDFCQDLEYLFSRQLIEYVEVGEGRKYLILTGLGLEILNHLNSCQMVLG
jgi:predicted transcriptional regulator